MEYQTIHDMPADMAIETLAMLDRDLATRFRKIALFKGRDDLVEAIDAQMAERDRTEVFYEQLAARIEGGEA